MLLRRIGGAIADPVSTLDAIAKESVPSTRSDTNAAVFHGARSGRTWPAATDTAAATANNACFGRQCQIAPSCRRGKKRGHRLLGVHAPSTPPVAIAPTDHHSHTVLVRGQRAARSDERTVALGRTVAATLAVAVGFGSTPAGDRSAPTRALRRCPDILDGNLPDSGVRQDAKHVRACRVRNTSSPASRW
jgi:hypothetical protein